MTDAADAFCVSYTPSWHERLGRLLGFRRHWPDVDSNENAANMPGWARTTVTITLSFGDRIRLLMFGKARLEMEQRMDVEVRTVVTDSAFSVVWPFGDA